MEATPCGVWVALAQSTTLHLYQTSNASLLATVDCSQPVHTLLTGKNNVANNLVDTKPYSKPQSCQNFKITLIIFKLYSCSVLSTGNT